MSTITWRRSQLEQAGFSPLWKKTRLLEEAASGGGRIRTSVG
jgi:hypothetical protein